MIPQSQSTGNSFTVDEAGAENAAAVTGAPGSVTAGTAVDDGREDLTVFFAIGMVINVLLVTAFLIWAVGQWRKKK